MNRLRKKKARFLELQNELKLKLNEYSFIDSINSKDYYFSTTGVSTINYEEDGHETKKIKLLLSETENILSEFSLNNATFFLKKSSLKSVSETFDNKSGSINEFKLQMMLLVYNASLNLTSEDSETRLKLLSLFDEIVHK